MTMMMIMRLMNPLLADVRFLVFKENVLTQRDCLLTNRCTTSSCFILNLKRMVYMSLLQQDVSTFVFVCLRILKSMNPLPVATIKKLANAACSESPLKLVTVLQATSVGFGFRVDVKENSYWTLFGSISN